MTISRLDEQVRINEGVDPNAAIKLLADASREAGNVLGRGSAAIALFNDYLGWAASQERLLANAFPASEVRRLLTSQRSWTIQVMDPVAYGATLTDLIALELNERIGELQIAEEMLKREVAIWNVPSLDSSFPERLHAAVVDTNVLMRSKGAMPDLDWSALTDTRRGQSIAIAIPAVVIEELDTLKHANGKMEIDGESHDRKWLATLALGWLRRTFVSDFQRVEVRPFSRGESGPSSALYAVLMFESLHHRPLPKNDSEIIDTALSVRPFAKSVTLVSYDLHMVFRTRHLGVRAIVPPEGDSSAA
ncbi:PIN domain-containing protein [Leifsonia sp. F6_8S_P_1B]|uniref:PIN domain-containing protein n=1 Tax=Leifsonia williamsii TaxID=3035919 RepID=A0ABT8KA41_9MICO|nr:PIN domain-containing protein [Leifsonia williamsii]MDN4613184.1 PIN domain-containing protein [Leifsonia williamsii]